MASASQAALNARGPSAPPGRSANHAAEIAAPEGRVLVRKHVGLHVAECHGLRRNLHTTQSGTATAQSAA
jgi:hypothetical protein